MASNILHTIGYEGAGIEDFLATLQSADVNTIIDVRAVPLSRKPGFSKQSLSGRAGEIGLSYVHLKSLGDPKEGRDAARMGLYKKFSAIFREHLRTDAAQVDLAAAVRLARASISCLLCFERDPSRCHRIMVAWEMQKLERLDIQHLDVRKGLAAQLMGAPSPNDLEAYAVG